MKAQIHQFLAAPMSGPQIEQRSFDIIDQEIPAHPFSPCEWEIVRRMIHTVGDVNLAAAVQFTPDAVPSGIAALRRGSPLYVDSNMIRAGLSLPRLREVCPDYSLEKIFCYVADGTVSEEAARTHLPRSLFAMRKARPALEGGIAVIGNAPVALLELNRMILEEGLRPALVIGLPVGFVHVQESKDELRRLAVPSIVIPGRRGGSPLAVSVVHALCTCAARSTSKGAP